MPPVAELEVHREAAYLGPRPGLLLRASGEKRTDIRITSVSVGKAPPGMTAGVGALPHLDGKRGRGEGRGASGREEGCLGEGEGSLGEGEGKP